MKSSLFLILTVCFTVAEPLAVYAASPEVANIRATQRTGTKLIDIYYDVTDTDNDPLTVSVQLYSNTHRPRLLFPRLFRTPNSSVSGAALFWKGELAIGVAGASFPRLR